MITENDLNLDLFKNLSEAFGPSGYEHRAVKIVKERILPHVDKITGDKTGSLIFKKEGKKDGPVVLMAGHIDEIGFIITLIHSSGFLNFHPIGYWSDLTLLGQRVTIVTKKGQEISGIICAVPDFVNPKTRGKVISKDQMFIDIGCSNKEEAESMGIRIGDPVVPDSQFQLIRDGKVATGKVFDNRVGVFIVMEVIRLLKEQNIDHPNVVVGAATTQEEVGIRGARTTIATVKPDISLAIDVDLATDIPGIPEGQGHSKMGKGFTLLVFDGTMIPNIWLREFTIELADKLGVDYQLSALPFGGTDAGAFHLYERGCPSLVFGIPCRNIHTHAGLISLNDLTNSINFLVEFLKVLDKKTVEDFTSHYTEDF